MHIEILVEDSSGGKLLEYLLPKLIGKHGDPHTWRVHSYKGIGRIPISIGPGGDPIKRILLDQLPRILKGYRKSSGIDAIVVVLDTDRRNCVDFLSELRRLDEDCGLLPPKTLFRLAIEEVEAWYLGDRGALIAAYPRAKTQVLDRYVQDSACDTWELLADAIHIGGSMQIKKTGWPLPGQIKHEWADRIGPKLDPDCNQSPSFGKLRDGLRQLIRND
jgi:hypothetical protein